MKFEEDFVLAWKFRVKSISPRFTRYYYVDATTGEVMDNLTIPLSVYDGIFDSPNYGNNLPLDTKTFLGNRRLKSNNSDGMKVITKKYTGQTLSFNYWSHTINSSDNWGTNHQKATQAHWSAGESWDYFRDIHEVDGTNGNQRKLRVVVNEDTSESIGGEFRFDEGVSSDELWLSPSRHNTNDHAVWCLDIVGHEFTHGIMYHFSHIYFFNEGGAIQEGFSDIFGIVINNSVTGSLSWELALECYSDPDYRRNAQDPKSSYRHSIGVDCDPNDPSDFAQGSPDTYEGDFWYDPGSGNCDRGGIHINSTVISHWFYLLSEGGAGTNDNGDFYFVPGIGLTDAANIALLTMTSLDWNSEFINVAFTSLAQAALEYDECSSQYESVLKAWYAVGVIPQEAEICDYSLGVKNQATNYDSRIFPNPTTENVEIVNSIDDYYKITLYNVNGAVVYTGSYQGNNHAIKTTQLPPGVYFIKLQNNAGYTQTLKLLKN